jgi:hypothetical protein
LAFLQVWGPYGQLPQAPTPPPPSAAGGSVDPFAPFQPLAVLGRPISDFQDDIVGVDLLSRLLTIGRSRSLEDITACATECNAALSSIPVLSWFRHWSFKPESESSVIMLELSKAVASSSVGMCVPANAVQTRKWWQSGPSPAESTWRCSFRGGQRKHVSRVLFRAHDTMRPKTVHVRGSTDGTLFTDLCRPRPVAFAGDIVIDLTSASRPLAISHIEIVLIGCQGNGASAYVLHCCRCASVVMRPT